MHHTIRSQSTNTQQQEPSLLKRYNFQLLRHMLQHRKTTSSQLQPQESTNHLLSKIKNCWTRHPQSHSSDCWIAQYSQFLAPWSKPQLSKTWWASKLIKLPGPKTKTRSLLPWQLLNGRKSAFHGHQKLVTAKQACREVVVRISTAMLLSSKTKNRTIINNISFLHLTMQRTISSIHLSIQGATPICFCSRSLASRESRMTTRCKDWAMVSRSKRCFTSKIYTMGLNQRGSKTLPTPMSFWTIWSPTLTKSSIKDKTTRK